MSTFPSSEFRSLVPQIGKSNEPIAMHQYPSSGQHQLKWRVYGEARRRWLVENDAAAAETTAFRMNAACSVYKYFALADRVILQFQDLCDRNAKEDAYVMGHRLINFLNAVSKHPAYGSAIPQRECTEKQFTWIVEKMRQVAFAIDEEQLNMYITNDFDPEIPDDDDVSVQSFPSTGEEFLPEASSGWENFAGWSASSPFKEKQRTDAPDTDESSQDIEEDQFASAVLRVRKLSHESEEVCLCDPELEEMSEDEEDVYDDEYEQDEYGSPFIYDVEPPMVATSILKRIARERVRYETDSEAADSWAQSNDDGAISETMSSVTGTDVVATSCDPARIAFREIMNRHSEQLHSLQLEVDSLQKSENPTTCVVPEIRRLPPSPPPIERINEGLTRSRGGIDDSRDTPVSFFHTSLLTLAQNSQDSPSSSPRPPPPTNSPEQVVTMRNRQPQPRDVRYIGFSTHAGIRQLAVCDYR